MCEINCASIEQFSWLVLTPLSHTQQASLFNLVSHCMMSQYVHYISPEARARTSAQKEYTCATSASKDRLQSKGDCELPVSITIMIPRPAPNHRGVDGAVCPWSTAPSHSSWEDRSVSNASGGPQGERYLASPLLLLSAWKVLGRSPLPWA